MLHQFALVRGQFEGEGGSGAVTDPHKCWTWSVTGKSCALALNLVLATSAKIRSQQVQLRGCGTGRSSFECIQQGDTHRAWRSAGTTGHIPLQWLWGVFSIPPANSRLCICYFRKHPALGEITSPRLSKTSSHCHSEQSLYTE